MLAQQNYQKQQHWPICPEIAFSLSCMLDWISSYYLVLIHTKKKGNRLRHLENICVSVTRLTQPEVADFQVLFGQIVVKNGSTMSRFLKKVGAFLQRLQVTTYQVLAYLKFKQVVTKGILFQKIGKTGTFSNICLNYSISVFTYTIL